MIFMMKMWTGPYQFKHFSKGSHKQGWMQDFRKGGSRDYVCGKIGPRPQNG